MRCASFFFMSTILSSVVKSGLALNYCHVASKAAVRVLSSSGPKNGAYCWKGIVRTPTAKQEFLKLSVTVCLGGPGDDEN